MNEHNDDTLKTHKKKSPKALRKELELSMQRLGISRRGMVASQHYKASEAGIEILESGGNAIDAAAACAFALGVCEPFASGLGGQTMMLVHIAATNRTFALDGSSRAPNRALPGLLSHKERLDGHLATTVPSTPATLAYAVDHYGNLPLFKVLEPAIRIAAEGYRITKFQRGMARRELKRLSKFPGGSLFLHNGKPYPTGSLLKQPALANTLMILARSGIESFYTGEIAKLINEDMSRNGGILQTEDLAQIPWPVERKPLSTHFAGRRLMTFPPPGAGQALIENLNILSQFPESRWDLDKSEGIVLLAEIIRRSGLDRRDRPFDPNFYPQVEDCRMLSEEYAELVAGQIRKRLKIHGETTHLSVADSDGNMVSLTQSIERVFGSAAASEELGFLYNNYMSAFEYEDMTHPYFLRPNAVPWASVAPTLVFVGHRPWLAIGSPGSERISSAIMQVLVRLLKQNPLDAVAAPRIHCSIKGKVSLEASRMRSDIPQELRNRGFKIDAREAFSFYLGCVQLVMHENDEFIGVADPRRDGSAGGPVR